MSDSEVIKIHEYLSKLQTEIKRQTSNRSHIIKVAEDKLAEANEKLSNMSANDNPEDYEKLLADRGLLQQILGDYKASKKP